MTRNFTIHLSPEQKAALKDLAKKSGMTLTEYISAVLAEATNNKDEFRLVAIKKQSEAEQAGKKLVPSTAK